MANNIEGQKAAHSARRILTYRYPDEFNELLQEMKLKYPERTQPANRSRAVTVLVSKHRKEYRDLYIELK